MMPRPGRPRIPSGIHESKTLALYNAGRTLLAQRDYEAFSVAQIAKLGRCSVGAFYVRFPDKTNFLSFVIGHSFDFATQSLADALANGGVKATGDPAKSQLAISLLTEQFADAEFAGALRAALKLGLSEPQYRAPFDQYRIAVTDYLAEWLGGDRNRQELQIRVALQVTLGTLTDCTLSDFGTESFSSGALQSTLVFLLQNAVSGTIKSGGKIEREKLPKTSSGKALPVSAPKKSPELADEHNIEKPLRKSARKKPPSASPTRGIRKI